MQIVRSSPAFFMNKFSVKNKQQNSNAMICKSLFVLSAHHLPPTKKPNAAQRNFKKDQKKQNKQQDSQKVQFHAICCPSSPPRRARSALTSDTYCRPSRNGIKYIKSPSVGSLIHPCIGIALSW